MAKHDLETEQAHLGWCYDEGDGVEVDHEKAFYWYTKAAEFGYPKARKVLKKLEATQNEQ